MSYRLQLDDLAEKKLMKLHPPVSTQVAKVLSALREDPRFPGVIRLVESASKGWRARAGKLRILFLIDDDAKLVTVYDIDTRDKAYRKK